MTCHDTNLVSHIRVVGMAKERGPRRIIQIQENCIICWLEAMLECAVVLVVVMVHLLAVWQSADRGLTFTTFKLLKLDMQMKSRAV